jgi:hypothetical protein
MMREGVGDALGDLGGDLVFGATSGLSGQSILGDPGLRRSSGMQRRRGFLAGTSSTRHTLNFACFATQILAKALGGSDKMARQRKFFVGYVRLDFQ